MSASPGILAAPPTSTGLLANMAGTRVLPASSALSEEFDFGPDGGAGCSFSRDGMEFVPATAIVMSIELSGSCVKMEMICVGAGSSALCDGNGDAPAGSQVELMEDLLDFPNPTSKTLAVTSRLLAWAWLPVIGLCCGDLTLPFSCKSGDGFCGPCRSFDGEVRRICPLGLKNINRVSPGPVTRSASRAWWIV